MKALSAVASCKPAMARDGVVWYLRIFRSLIENQWQVAFNPNSHPLKNHPGTKLRGASASRISSCLYIIYS